jgi:uncharacterized protein (TIGR00255 family)
MTGYGKGEIQGERFNLSVEIKTVNNRFKDIRFKMGSVFNSKEMSLRQQIESEFRRGTFDIYVNYKKNQKAAEQVDLDLEKISKFIDTFKAISEKKNVALTLSPTEFFRNEFYIEDSEKESELIEYIDTAFQAAISNLKESRKIEGGKLIEKLIEHKNIYEKHYQYVKENKSLYQEKVKEKLLKRVEEFSPSINIDSGRILQEVVFYLEKLDIDEEINRIEIHLAKLDGLLTKAPEEVGRQIDFLVQELNRETNTIGSKSGGGEISENVVQMKVQLEKIREQALNLE